MWMMKIEKNVGYLEKVRNGGAEEEEEKVVKGRSGRSRGCGKIKT